jgi:splicing factor U2AF subunit
MNVAEVAKLNPALLMPLMTSANPMATRQTRRIYIGQLPANVSETELAEFFNTAMMTAGVTSTKAPPVVAVQMNREKGFAFLEFRTAEESTAAMAFDGITLQGSSLKVRRPKDYGEMNESDWNIMPGGEGFAAASSQPQTFIPGIVQTNVADTPNKIFIGGLPMYLDEEGVKELLQAFGQLKAFNLVRETGSNQSKGFAFCEYLDEGVTDKAIQGLNGMRVGEKTLQVQRSTVARHHAPEIVLPSRGVSNPTALNFLNISIPVPTILSSLTQEKKPPPTRIVQLCNLFSVEDLADMDFYEDVVQDLTEEARKFGQLVSVVVPRPNIKKRVKAAPAIINFDPTASSILSLDSSAPAQGAGGAGSADPSAAPPSPPGPEIEETGPPPQGVGRVYLEYATREDANKASEKLMGRKFNKRTVIVSFYPEHLWAAGRLEGPDERETNEVAK